MNKFGAKKVENEYGKFDSIAEYVFFKKLTSLKKAESIDDRVVEIERQKVYECIINNKKCFK
jgi:hypothetical protein